LTVLATFEDLEVLRTQAYIAGKAGLIDTATTNAVTAETKELAEMLFSLARNVKQTETDRVTKPK